MNLDNLRLNLQKAGAILEAATPEDLGSKEEAQMRLLIHSARDYVELTLEALEDDKDSSV